MHDDMMGESPQEHIEQDPTGTDATATMDNEPATISEVATNTNSNNNSPVEGTSLKEGDRQVGRPSSLFNIQFKSHVRASSDTTAITYTKTATAPSKLTEVHAMANMDSSPRIPRHGEGEPGEISRPSEMVARVPGAEILLNLPGSGTLDTTNNEDDRNSTIVDIGYDL